VVVERPAEVGVCDKLGVAYAEIGVGGIDPQAVLARTELDLRNALAAQPLIGLERLGHRRVVDLRQDRRQRHAVLDRLVRALSEVGQHGMRGIAKEAQPALGPGRQRLTIVQRRPERRIDLLQ
jgi:hypothetical protein